MTDYLYARPSFIGGVMSVLDLFATSQVYNSSDSEEDANRRAANADILALKNDMSSAIEKVLTECPAK